MKTPGSNSLNVSQRRQRVRELALAGHSQIEMAKVIGVSVKTIERDMKAMRSENQGDEIVKRKQFERARTRRTNDGSGKVAIRITLLERGRPTPGNITRQITVKYSRVSVVAEVIEETLFGPAAEAAPE